MLSGVTELTAATVRKLIGYARQGLPVVFYDSAAAVGLVGQVRVRAQRQGLGRGQAALAPAAQAALV